MTYTWTVVGSGAIVDYIQSQTTAKFDLPRALLTSATLTITLKVETIIKNVKFVSPVPANDYTASDSSSITVIAGEGVSIGLD